MKLNKQSKIVLLSLFLPLILLSKEINFNEEESIKRSFIPSFQSGTGSLDYNNANFQYTTNTPSPKDFDYKLYQPARIRANKNFTVITELKNSTIPESSKELASVGIEIYQRKNLSNRFATELSCARLQGYFSRTVFSQLVEFGEKTSSCYSKDLRLAEVTTVKIDYIANNKVFYISYLQNEEWIKVGSFGIAGSGGENGNAQWKIKNNENLLLYIYGFSTNMNVYEGDIQIKSLKIEK